MRYWRWALWGLGVYVAANVLWAIVRARVLALIALSLFAGCASVAVLERGGTLVECRENIWDGIPATLDKCVEAYEQAGFVLKGRK